MEAYFNFFLEELLLFNYLTYIHFLIYFNDRIDFLIIIKFYFYYNN